jgi:hypothetical protein
MAINQSNIASGVKSFYSTLSSSLAKDTTQKNQSILNQSILGTQNSTPVTAQNSTPYTGSSQNRASTPGSVPVAQPSSTTGTTNSATSQPVSQGVIPSSTNPTINALVNQVNELINQVGTLSPENQALAQSINNMAGQEMVALNKANSAQMLGDYRALNDAIQEMNTARAEKESQIETLSSQLSGARADYVASLAPTTDELALRQKLADIEKEAADYALATDRAVAGFEGQGRGIPLSIIRGQQEKLVKQRSFGKQEIANEEANLLTRLGLEEDARALRAEIAKGNYEGIKDEIGILDSASKNINSNIDSLIDQFTALDNQQQNTLTNFLETMNGVRYDDLATDAQQYIDKMATAMNVPKSYIKEAMNVLADKSDLEKLYTQSQIDNQNEEDTKTLSTSILNKTLAAGVPSAVAQEIYGWLQQGFTLESIRGLLKERYGESQGYSYLDTFIPILGGQEVEERTFD